MVFYCTIPFTPSFADVWILGDSLVRWAEARAVERGTPNLRQPGVHIVWDGVSSRGIQDLHSAIQYGLLQGQSPAMIILHLAGNNIDNTNTWKIIKCLIAEIEYLFLNFPEALIVWTYILPRLHWRNTTNDDNSLRTMDRKRKRINRHIKELILNRPNGRVVVHAEITRWTPGFFGQDGVHLSDVGYDMYLLTLQDAISLFLANLETKSVGL